MDSGVVDEFIAEATEAADGQKVLGQKAGVTIVSKKLPGCEPDMIKAWGVLPAPAHAVYRALCELEERQRWDKNAVEVSVIEKMDSNSSVYYSVVQGIFGMQPRDFVDLRHMVVLPSGVHLIVFTCTEHPSCPVKEGVVRCRHRAGRWLIEPGRGRTLLSGQHIKPIDQHSCLLTAVTQVDIKGSIPVYLVNKVATRTPVEWFHALRVHLKDSTHAPVAPAVSSDLEYLQAKLRRCNRSQLIGVLRCGPPWPPPTVGSTLAEAKPRLVPVIAAGVSSAMAKRDETEYMIQYAHEAGGPAGMLLRRGRRWRGWTRSESTPLRSMRTS